MSPQKSPPAAPQPVREWAIGDLARYCGVTSRTLRHYGTIGLLPATRVAANGYRYYGEAQLLRLQRILILRDLGLDLAAIGKVIDGQKDEVAALDAQLALLRNERERITRQIASVERTIEAKAKGQQLMAKDMFDGFDHTHYRQEVEQRWGKEAYARSDKWWRGMTQTEREEWKTRQNALLADWHRAAEAGEDPTGPIAQALAKRHVDWLRSVPGTPAAENPAVIGKYVTGLGEMYVADPRFGANYGGAEGAGFVRDALRAYAEREL